ncbi:calponin homology domain-containing protein [Suillus ampliporus]|nr:calponin homology domain-containing protein [Suillus ampliporus]
MTDNNIATASATGIGCSVDIKIHPELYLVCEDGETIENLRLTPDQFLLHSFNYHLKAAEVNNFGRDVSDGENHTVILNPINAPLHLSKPKMSNNAQNKSSNAEAIGCRKYLTPSSLVSGNPCLKLAFIANLFNTWPGLEPLDEQGAKDYGAIEDFDAEGEREALFNLFGNLRDGLVVLQLFEKILAGSAVWRRISKLKVENTSYAVELGKQNRMHLVGIQGADIVDAYKMLVLDLSWQLMKFMLVALSKTGKPISDTDMLKWANTTVQRGKPGVRPIRSFKNPVITTGLFFPDLLDMMRPCIVDPALVLNNGRFLRGRWYSSDADIFFQAKLAISIARKMNALIFLVSEDIVDVRSRLVRFFSPHLVLSPC